MHESSNFVYCLDVVAHVLSLPAQILLHTAQFFYLHKDLQVNFGIDLNMSAKKKKLFCPKWKDISERHIPCVVDITQGHNQDQIHLQLKFNYNTTRIWRDINLIKSLCFFFHTNCYLHAITLFSNLQRLNYIYLPLMSSVTLNQMEDVANFSALAGGFDMQPDMLSYVDDEFVNICLGAKQQLPLYPQSHSQSHSQSQSQPPQLNLTQDYDSHYYYGHSHNLNSGYSSQDENAFGSSTPPLTSTSETFSASDIHQMQLPLQLHHQDTTNTVNLFPPATACTPHPVSDLMNGYISRRESFEAEFDLKNMFPIASSAEIQSASSQDDYASNYGEIAEQTILEDDDDVVGDNDVEFTNFFGEQENDRVDIDLSSIESKRYPLIRGVNSGGSTTKPPQSDKNSDDSRFIKCKLSIIDGDESSVCLPEWDSHEKGDKRRIIRVERRQRNNEIIISFHIVSSDEQDQVAVSSKDVDVTEVSCLECLQSDEFSEDDDFNYVTNGEDEDSLNRQYYVTSVEVIKIVELLIGTQNTSAKERRVERGRIRSNLVPFWSKKPISSKKTHSASSSPASSDTLVGKTNCDLRNELAHRIMNYETRKPRRFDKEVRILEWKKLVPALRRALQSYYVKIPVNELD